MKTKIVLLLTLATALVYAADQPKAVDSAAAFDRLKSLAGNWEAETAQGKAHLSYEIIANGTSLVEREQGGMMQPMITVYHLDGKRLILSHFCMAGNQPRMQAQSFDAAAGVLDFRFLDATGLSSPAAGHMHNARFRFVDNDHLETQWEFYENGKKKFGETAVYTRVR